MDISVMGFCLQRGPTSKRRALGPGSGTSSQKLNTFPYRNTTSLPFCAEIGLIEHTEIYVELGVTDSFST